MMEMTENDDARSRIWDDAAAASFDNLHKIVVDIVTIHLTYTDTIWSISNTNNEMHKMPLAAI